MQSKQPIDALMELRGAAARLVVVNHYSVWYAPYDIASIHKFISYLSAIAGVNDRDMRRIFIQKIVEQPTEG